MEQLLTKAMILLGSDFGKELSCYLASANQNATNDGIVHAYLLHKHQHHCAPMLEMDCQWFRSWFAITKRYFQYAAH